MNAYAPSRYDERLLHLSFGLEPRDAHSDLRLDRGVDVRVERFTRPVSSWRTWQPGETLTGALPRLERHRSGRFAARYEDPWPVGALPTFRVVDDELVGASRRPGTGRRVVPRRIRVALADADAVRGADADPNLAPHPLWQRAFPIWLFPGAAASVPARATVLRGTVVRIDPAGGGRTPVRWCRIEATDQTGQVVGWAHGDERGEFVLVAESPGGGVGVPPDPVSVQLQIGSVVPPAAPDPGDPVLAVVDPLWDLPVEPIVASPVAETEPTLTGRRFLVEHTVVAPDDPAPIDLPHGRHTVREVRIT